MSWRGRIRKINSPGVFLPGTVDVVPGLDAVHTTRKRFYLISVPRSGMSRVYERVFAAVAWSGRVLCFTSTRTVYIIIVIQEREKNVGPVRTNNHKIMIITGADGRRKGKKIVIISEHEKNNNK